VQKEKYPHLYKRRLQLDRYFKYKEELQWEAARKGFYMRDAGMHIKFYIPVSPSWRKGKKEKYHLKPHQYKPDVDNLLKAVTDILREKQDCMLYNLTGLDKFWINAPTGFIQIDITEIPQPDRPTHLQRVIPFRKSRRKKLQ